jgi:hypothetical protein
VDPLLLPGSLKDCTIAVPPPQPVQASVKITTVTMIKRLSRGKRMPAIVQSSLGSGGRNQGILSAESGHVLETAIRRTLSLSVSV